MNSCFELCGTCAGSSAGTGHKGRNPGSYAEASKAFNELIDRAKAKGFQKVRHSFGCSGVNLTFSDGKTRVELVYIKSDREYEWLMFFEKCRMDREARENKAA